MEEFDLENPLMALSEPLFDLESDHMPSRNYLRDLKAQKLVASVRQEAISFISQLSCNCEQSVGYLAVNYLDRFLSSHGVPQRKQWIIRLLAVSCVSIATKMLNTEPAPSVLQWEEGFVLDPQTVRRMEVAVLGALNWRMRSITPFSFINFFTSLVAPKDRPPLMLALRARASQFIFRSQNEIDVLEFKPSIIAASALLSAAEELLVPSHHFQSFRKAISGCSFVDQEELMGCWCVMGMGGRDPPAISSSNTAVNVLDQHWWSSEGTVEEAVGTEGDAEGREMTDCSASENSIRQC